MAFESIDSADIVAGKPATQTLFSQIKNSLDFLNSQVNASAGKDVPNGSFEVDSDSDGIPDNWTRNLYPGGSGSYETTSPLHGAKSFKFVHPGGVDNGGGYLTSDYIECSEMVIRTVSMVHYATATGMKNIVQALFYDKAKTYISTTDLYNSTANPTSAALLICGFTPPSGARFFKIRYIGGYTDTNVAGTSYFDALELDSGALLWNARADFTISEAGAYCSTWTDLVSANIVMPIIGLPVKIMFTYEHKIGVASGTGQTRFRIGSIYSDATNIAVTSYETVRCFIDLAAQTAQLLTIYGQGIHANQTVTIRKTGAQAHTRPGDYL